MKGRLPHLSRTQQVAVETGQTYVEDTPQYSNHQIQNNPEQSSVQVPRPLISPITNVPNYSRWELKPNEPTFPQADSVFTTESQYDGSSSFVRPTSMCIGSQPNKWKFPLGGWFMPFGGSAVPSIRVTTPPRCARCKAYLNCFFKVEANGAVTCNICAYRYNPQQKIDPTLVASAQLMTQGVVDYKVTDQLYMKKQRDQVKILICLQMTKATIQNNLFVNIIQSIKASVQAQFQPSIRMGIIVYDQSIHFYKVKSVQHELIEYSVNDSLNALCPLADSQLFYQISNQESRLKFQYLLDKLSEKAKASPNTNIITNYYSVLSCLLSAFGKHSGRVVLFSMSDPTAAPGKLRSREKQEIKTPLKPISQQYVNLAREFVKARIGVDRFIFGRQNMYQHELPTTHFLSSSTGGNIFYYTLYNPLVNGDHLHFTIYKTLTKQYAYDVDFTCRISNGLSVSKFITSDGIHQQRDVSLGCFDTSHSIAAVFNHQDKLTDVAYVQFAIMFTNIYGQRVVRIINYRMQVVDKLQIIHQGADYLAVANIIGRLTVNHLFKIDPPKVLEQFTSSIVEMLIHYKNEKGEFKFSELQVHPHLKNVLAYLHSISVSILFTNLSKINSDRKIDEIIKINSLGFRDFANKYYPKLYCIDLNIYDNQPFPGDFLQNDPDVAILPQNLALTSSSIQQNSAYLLQDNDYIYLFVMPQAPEQLLLELFDKNDISDITIDIGLPELQSGHNIRIANIIAEIRRRNTGFYLPLLVLSPATKSMFDQRLHTLLKQDNKERSYLFFLKQLHGRVQNGK